MGYCNAEAGRSFRSQEHMKSNRGTFILRVSLLVPLCTTQALNVLQLTEKWNVTIMGNSDNHGGCAYVCV